jgi:hypothetical protein
MIAIDPSSVIPVASVVEFVSSASAYAIDPPGEGRDLLVGEDRWSMVKASFRVHGPCCAVSPGVPLTRPAGLIE